jgi:hypothetical protein
MASAALGREHRVSATVTESAPPAGISFWVQLPEENNQGEDQNATSSNTRKPARVGFVWDTEGHIVTI